ncbi:kinase-regulated stress-responsive transcription factor skn7 [Massospora cicadina]|nr:kinase-regulated stress-responsive transcription factor skn7 [Massospora cicadina]
MLNHHASVLLHFVKSLIAALGGNTRHNRKLEPHLIKFVSRRLRILIVDDNLLCLRILSRTLERYCCCEIAVVHQALGPVEALALLSSLEFDLIFMDIDMPHLNRPCTTNCLPTDIALYLRAGMDGYVPKPFTHLQISEAVQRALHPHEGIALAAWRVSGVAGLLNLPISGTFIAHIPIAPQPYQLAPSEILLNFLMALWAVYHKPSNAISIYPDSGWLVKLKLELACAPQFLPSGVPLIFSSIRLRSGFRRGLRNQHFLGSQTFARATDYVSSCTHETA